jgi:hypothetical protein
MLLDNRYKPFPVNFRRCFSQLLTPSNRCPPRAVHLSTAAAAAAAARRRLVTVRFSFWAVPTGGPLHFILDRR